jgi:hypothetical protein
MFLFHLVVFHLIVTTRYWTKLRHLMIVILLQAQRLLLWWQKNKPEGYDGPGVMNVTFPEREKFYYVYFAPWTLLSFLFTAGWVAILLFVL